MEIWNLLKQIGRALKIGGDAKTDAGPNAGVVNAATAATSTKLTEERIQSELDRFFNAVYDNRGYMEITKEWGTKKHLPTMLEAKDNNGWTALMYAVICRGRIDVAQALLAAGKECGILKNMLEAENNDGDTALILAARYGCIDAVQTLLAAGKECGILKEMLRYKNHKGKTVFDAAIINRKMTKLLENAALKEAFDEDVLEAISKQPEIRGGLVSRAKRFVMGEIGKESLEAARAEIAAELRENAEEQIENAEKTKKLAEIFENAGAGSKGDHQDPVSERNCHGTPHAIVASRPSCGRK